MRRGSLGPVDQEKILQEVGKSILSVIPGDWEKVELHFLALATRKQADLIVVRGGGYRERHFLPGDAISKMSELRTGMYQDGKGAWFSSYYDIHPPGKYSFNYDYDNEPDFGDTPSLDSDYSSDLYYFPRNEENIPNWLRQKIQNDE